MAVFLAEPYEDEIIQSCAFRYLKHMGVSNAPNLLERLFGTTSFLAIRANRLHKFAEQTRMCWGRSAEEIAEQLTLFPYLSAYMLRDERAKLLDAMCSEDISRSSKPISRVFYSLRYCDICFAGDRVAGRDEYWRRNHQIPGVLFCHEHGKLLSCIPIDESENWNIDPAKRREVGEKIELSMSSAQASRCITLALKSKLLLTTSQGGRAMSILRWGEIALAAGFKRSKGFVDIRQLEQAVELFYGDDVVRRNTEMFGTNFGVGRSITCLNHLSMIPVHVFLRWELFFEELEKSLPGGAWSWSDVSQDDHAHAEWRNVSQL